MKSEYHLDIHNRDRQTRYRIIHKWLEQIETSSESQAGYHLTVILLSLFALAFVGKPAAVAAYLFGRVFMHSRRHSTGVKILKDEIREIRFSAVLLNRGKPTYGRLINENQYLTLKLSGIVPSSFGISRAKKQKDAWDRIAGELGERLK